MGSATLEKLRSEALRLTEAERAELAHELIGVGSNGLLCDVLHPVGEVTTRSRWRKWFAIFLIQRNGFFDDVAELVEYRLFIRSVATSIDEPRRTSDVALVFLGPFNNLRVSRTVFHVFDSSIARRTARTW